MGTTKKAAATATSKSSTATKTADNAETAPTTAATAAKGTTAEPGQTQPPETVPTTVGTTAPGTGVADQTDAGLEQLKAALKQTPAADTDRTDADKQKSAPDGGQFLNPNPHPVEDNRVRVTAGYISALAEAVSLGMPLPGPFVTEEGIKAAVDQEKQHRDAQAKSLADQQARAMELSKTTKAELEDKQFIMLARETPNGPEKKRFTRIAWSQMSGNKDGWRVASEEPEEVKNLKK